MLDLLSLITSLSSERPLFHSEADFQHALAWEIHKENPEDKVRLEYNPSFIDENMYTDIWVTHSNGNSSVLELKYITKKMECRLNDEIFNLKNHGAADLARYDFIKDIVRLEKVCSSLENTKGYALMLTNEPQLWKQPVIRSKTPIDIEFRIHQDKLLQGDLAWGPNTGKGTMKGRESTLSLSGYYEMNWISYAEKIETKNGEFNFLLVEVASKL